MTIGQPYPSPPVEPGYDVGAMFDLLGGIKVELGNLHADRQREYSRWQQELQLLPIDAIVTGAAPANSVGHAVINCGGPAQGRQWELRRLIVGASTGTRITAATVKFDVFAKAGAPPQFGAATGTNNPGIDGLIWHAKGSPFMETFSARQAVVHEGEQLYVLITGGATGQAYTAFGTALDYLIRPQPSTINT